MRINYHIDILILLTAAFVLIFVPACSIVSIREDQVVFAAAGAADKPLRLHVLAASDRPIDQSIKLAVRDQVLEYLEATMKGCKSKEEAMTIIAPRLPQIELVCNTCLDHCRAAYSATATLETADFPEIPYDGAVFAAGKYDALRIVLGDGTGHNWWCVLFPPLCFVDMAAAADEDVLVTALADTDSEKADNYVSKYRISWKITDIMLKQ